MIWGAIRDDAKEIHVVARDAGKGFDINATLRGTGLGLVSMRERARLLNGTIQIESKPGAGTTIHARVPQTPFAGASLSAAS